MPEKFPSQDEAELARLIREVTVGHVAFMPAGRAAADGEVGADRAAAIERWPVVLPIAISYEPGGHEPGPDEPGADEPGPDEPGDGGRPFSLLLHGSTGSRWLRTLSEGGPMSVAITALDGLVVARSAFESSMHYRSAVLFGRCATVSAADKGRALDVITESLIPGRVAELRAPLAKELAATLVLRMQIADWSYKVSAGWPEDPPEDVVGPAWAGVLPRRAGFATALPTHDLSPGIAVPDSVLRLLAE
jgi:nitroimidazol reductase NimA-like FMN-containing flavoprotein (pyridoxamine 5'-phosphate oxidase superfamily)